MFQKQALKNDIKTAMKPTGVKLQENPVKIFYAVYICEKSS